MVDQEKYDGWTNYETWNVALWLEGDEANQYWREQALELLQIDGNDNDDAKAQLAQQLQGDIVVMNQPKLGASMYADLLGAALSEVNWYEIAAHYVDEMFESLEPNEP